MCGAGEILASQFAAIQTAEYGAHPVWWSTSLAIDLMHGLAFADNRRVRLMQEVDDVAGACVCRSTAGTVNVRGP